MKRFVFLGCVFLLVLSAAGCSTRLFTPGSYIGVAPGMYGQEVAVDVVVDAWTIQSITVMRYNEPLAASEVALRLIPEAIIEGQTLNVEPVPGAAGSSLALVNAVADALSAATADYGVSGAKYFKTAGAANSTVAVVLE